MIGAASPPQGGGLLREWRLRRRLSQQDLALVSAVSARHLSFIETGRARPSREMVLHLADRLDIPLRERNRILLAAGHAPQFAEHDLADAELAPVRDALERFLGAHEPYPALVFDLHWNVVLRNRALDVLTEGVDPALLEPPANALRVAFHPRGMAPRILNLAEFSAHALRRLRRQIALTGDSELERLYEELARYPGVGDERSIDALGVSDIVVPVQFRRGDAQLTLFSTMAVFGTALDITLAELSIEAFYPADASTAQALRALRAEPSAP